MINLLPLEAKETLRLEEKKRMVTILWLLVLFPLFCLILILSSVKVYSKSQIEDQRTLLLVAKKEFEQSEAQELQGKVNSINQILTDLNNFYQKKVYFSEILEKISETLPQGIRLNDLSATLSFVGGKTNVKVSLSGFAPFREDLFEFKKNLEKEPEFKDISFPPVSWVKPFDIDFSVTFTISH